MCKKTRLGLKAIETKAKRYKTARYEEKNKRIIITVKKNSEKARMRRRKLRAKKLMKNVNITTVTYLAGGFGLSEKSDDLAEICTNKKVRKLAKNDTEPVEQVFLDENQILVLITKIKYIYYINC